MKVHSGFFRIPLFVPLLVFNLLLHLPLIAQVFTGALPTDPVAYEKMGKAPLPLGSNIPRRIDLSSRLPPPGNQYAQNSCVAWTLAYANYSFINQEASGCSYGTGEELNFDCLFSPSFIYNQVNKGKDEGCLFTDAFQLMQTSGVAPLSAMPYDPENWWRKPKLEAKEKAAAHRISSYWQLGKSGEDIFTETKAFLAQGNAVIASVKVDNYLMKKENFPDPYIWQQLGNADGNMGHAILITGYDDSTGCFRFINSFGAEWGNKGYGLIAYSVFSKVVNEAFIIKKNNAPTLNQVFLKEEKKLDTSDKRLGLDFTVLRVEHFQFPPYYRPSPQELFNKEMVFHGSVSIPKGLGKKAQIVIYFFNNINGAKGGMVTSMNPVTRTLTGQAATGTGEVLLPDDKPFENTFYARMRYVDLNIPKGYPNTIIHNNLIAEPVLLVDGFPVKIGQPHLFFVRM